jgi:hypothetical protein
MADVCDLDHVFANPIEDFVGVSDDEFHPNLGIVCWVAAVGLLSQLHHGRAYTGQDITRTIWRPGVKTFKNLFAIRESLWRKASPY